MSDFRVGQYVVYPVHGVGQIIDIENQAIDSTSVKLLVIKFENDKMVLRLPLNNVEKSGLRPIFTKKSLNEIEDILKKRVRMRRMMWSRRAQEYETKINSGDPCALAEVVRELYKKNEFEQSYSERQLYQIALLRLAKEVAVVSSIPENKAVEHLQQVLEAA